MRTESMYAGLSPEEYEEHMSNFLVSSWSYSKVSSFARNEKAFEMQYIYGLYSRSSPTTIAGNAYHHALEYYFTHKMKGEVLPLVELEISAYQYLENIPGNKWKLSKSWSTIEECLEKATKTVTALLSNFYKERATYENGIKEILAVEVLGQEFVVVNGVEIPIPCTFKIDIVVRTIDDTIAVIDHKSKTTFTDEEEIALSIGIQAITYAIGYEAMAGETVDEVWFVENKHSKNKDGGPQLCANKVTLDDNTRKLYEALLYEPLKRMFDAVQDPDYVYLINESDNYVDKAELYDFWCRSMICEVEDFNVEESKKELVGKRLKKIRTTNAMVNPAIIKSFKQNASQFIQYDLSVTNMSQTEKIEHILNKFGTPAQVAHIFEGYSSNTFLLSVSAGVRVASIHKSRLDIANALDVENVRISSNLVRYEEKSFLSVEVGKKCERILPFSPSDRKGWKIPLGKDNFGNVIFWDMDNPATPHALICGQTGSGKSVEIFNIIEHVQEAGAQRVVILDPKYEFEECRSGRVDVLNGIEEIEWMMFKLVQQMNKLVYERRQERIVIIFDEFADALANSKKGKALEGEKSLEENLRILAQKGRSCGIRICAATQRASVKIITGDTKVNFPVQICFRVNKEADSRVILDEAGAEALAGKGDGLIKSPEYGDTIRFQAYYKPQNQPA